MRQVEIFATFDRRNLKELVNNFLVKRSDSNPRIVSYTMCGGIVSCMIEYDA
mgnify:CR=1 FL=1